MPRRARLALYGVSTQIVQRGIDRDACFLSDDDRRHYLALLAELAPALGCAVHAYVLMTNHVHLLATPTRAKGLFHLMRQLNQRPVRAINRAYRRSATLWEGRFRFCLFDSDGYLLPCQRYIEFDPVRAAMVRSPWDYPWSSHRMNVGTLPSTLMPPHEPFLALAPDTQSRASAYRDFVVQGMPDDAVAEIRRAASGSYALDSPRFQEQVGAMLGHRALPVIPGQPQRTP